MVVGTGEKWLTEMSDDDLKDMLSLGEGVMSYWYYRSTGPRDVKGGIKAQTKRGAFGQSWWAKRVDQHT